MVRIDFTKIPEADLKIHSMTLLECAKRFYQNPKNVEAFEKWKKERSKLRA